MSKSARADCERICVPTKAFFSRHTLCMARKNDEVGAQIARKAPMAIYSAFAYIWNGLFAQIHQIYARLAVELRQADLHHLAARGGDVLADIVGADGQLAVAAIDEHGQLDRPGTAEREDRLDRRAGGAAGVDHVVAEHDVAIGHVERQRGASGLGLLGDVAEIVAVESDVQTAAGHVLVLDLMDVAADTLGERLAPAADADEDDVVNPAVVLVDLVGNAHERAAHRRLVHDLCLELHGRVTPFRATNFMLF